MAIAPVRVRTGFVFLLTATLLILAGPPGAAVAQGSDEDREFRADWEASLLTWHLRGTVSGWLRRDGALRLEIRTGDDSRFGPTPETSGAADIARDDPARHWSGEGWCLVLSPADEGTLNAWFESWQPTAVELAVWCRTVLAAFLRAKSDASGPLAVSAELPPRFWRSAAWRSLPAVPLPALRITGVTEVRAPAATRAVLVDRGNGRGGTGEMLRLQRRELGRRRLRVGSSRRSGTLELTLTHDRFIPPLPDDAFLPLWPLAELLAD